MKQLFENFLSLLAFLTVIACLVILSPVLAFLAAYEVIHETFFEKPTLDNAHKLK